MNLVACGINHKTAPLTLREQLTISSDYLVSCLEEFLIATQAEEAMILSTCNRTEFYCINGDVQHTLNWLHRTKKIPKTSLQDHWYVYHQENAVRHMLRVASGLDSMILGEPQISGQLKKAFYFAYSLGVAGNQFKRLFQYIFSISKQVRHQTAISAHPVSLAFSLVACAKRIFANLADTRVLLIGAGETIALVAKHLLAQSIHDFVIANRTLQHAERLVSLLGVGGEAIPLDKISHHLPHIDLVVSATTCPFIILGKGMLESALKKRRRRPLFMADLGMPHDIETEVNQLEDIYLYTLHDLQSMIQKNQSDRQSEAIKAEALIETKIQDYLKLIQLQKAIPVIRAYRHQAERWRDQELDRAFSLLKKGFAAEEIMQELARRLTNKLLHKPSLALRQMALLKHQESSSIMQLFNTKQS